MIDIVIRLVRVVSLSVYLSALHFLQKGNKNMHACPYAPSNAHTISSTQITFIQTFLSETKRYIHKSQYTPTHSPIHILTYLHFSNSAQPGVSE